MLLHSGVQNRGGGIPTILALLLNAFLALFLADAGISALDELGFAASGLHLLAWIRGPLAMLTLLASPAVFLLPIAFQRVPRSVFVPLALFSPAYTLLGMPLAYWLGWDNYGMVQTTVAQALLGVAALALMRRHTGGRLWLVAGDLGPPLVALGPTLRMVAFTLLVVLPGLLGSFVGLCERCLDRFTGGFMELHWDGLQLVERVYTHANSEVRLVGMMHIGDRGSYAALVETFDRPDTLVLAEGVRDEYELLGRGLPYERVAERAGLASQQDLASYRPGIRQRNADVDVSDLSEGTLRQLKLTTRIVDDEGFDFEALLDLLLYSVESTEDDLDVFWKDVIELRNSVLIGHLHRAVLEEPVVVVPWGAAHLPGIQQELYSMGYELELERRHPLLSWAGE